MGFRGHRAKTAQGAKVRRALKAHEANEGEVVPVGKTVLMECGGYRVRKATGA